MEKLYINADDFGISKDVNVAISYCFNKELINRTTIMVNMPAFENAVLIAKKNEFYDKIGLHLNLIEGVPLTDTIKHTTLCNSEGIFSGEFFKNSKNRFWVNKKIRKALRLEIEAQINKYLHYGFSLKHIDSHQHTHTNPSVIIVLMPLLKQYRFKTIRLSRNIPCNNIKGSKKIYKKLFNKIILKFNRANEKTNDIIYFGNQKDVELYIKHREVKKGKIEMEIHPSMDENNVLKELVCTEDIQTWLKKFK